MDKILKEIEEALDEHHATRDMECDPDCFCWAVEEILLKMKEAA